MAAAVRGKDSINPEECKGCGLCIEACPPECLELASLEHAGRRT
jgi:2-oxoglutarate ferredoxin oxidoreductase subunit delta/2-oxoisovalerate ferredoxin oxidoreductase delta subunit